MRGALTSLYQLMITFGILVAAFVDMLLMPREHGWRTAIWIQVVPALLLLCGMPFLPRSPRWLVHQGRTEEAKQVLMALREPQEAQAELEGIISEHAQSGKVPFASLMHGRVSKLIVVGVSLQMLQQLIGMNAFMYFGPRIFESFGVPSNLFQTINNLVMFISTFPAVYLADKCGRRKLLIPSALGMALSSIMMGILGFTVTRNGDAWEPTSPACCVIMAGMVFVFTCNFSYGWGPMVWVYCAEIFPLRFRGICVGITTTANWVGNYVIAQFTPLLLGAIGFNTFFIFGAFSLIAAALGFWLPETKGVSLEHIGKLFDEKFGNAPIHDSEVDMYGSVLPPEGKFTC